MTLFNQPIKRFQKKKHILTNCIVYLNNKPDLLVCAFLILCFQARADWFEVDNYAGKIGDYYVHVSLQRFVYIHKNTLIKGSYYYDKYREPIVLYGKFEGNDIFLCEFKNYKQYEPFPKKPDFDDCAFRLKDYEDKLMGEWKNKDVNYPVELKHTISYASISDKGFEKKDMEIPFWGHTREHSFIGIYEMDDEEIQVNKINVVSKKDGKVIQVIDPQLNDCWFGFYTTYIYEHIFAENDTTIKLNCEGSAYADRVRFYQYDKKKEKYIYIKDYYDKYYK